jgi:hypothetical protein
VSRVAPDKPARSLSLSRGGPLCGRHLDSGCRDGSRLRNRIAGLTQGVYVKGDRLASELFHFLPSVAYDSDAWQVRAIGAQESPSYSITTRYSLIISASAVQREIFFAVAGELEYEHRFAYEMHGVCQSRYIEIALPGSPGRSLSSRRRRARKAESSTSYERTRVTLGVRSLKLLPPVYGPQGSAKPSARRSEPATRTAGSPTSSEGRDARLRISHAPRPISTQRANRSGGDETQRTRSVARRSRATSDN